MMNEVPQTAIEDGLKYVDWVKSEFYFDLTGLSDEAQIGYSIKHALYTSLVGIFGAAGSVVLGMQDINYFFEIYDEQIDRLTDVVDNIPESIVKYLLPDPKIFLKELKVKVAELRGFTHKDAIAVKMEEIKVFIDKFRDTLSENLAKSTFDPS